MSSMWKLLVNYKIHPLAWRDNMGKYTLTAFVPVSIAGSIAWAWYLKNVKNPKIKEYNDAYYEALQIRLKEDRINHVERVKKESDYMLDKLSKRFTLTDSLDSLVGQEIPKVEEITNNIRESELFQKFRPVGVNQSDLPWITHNTYNAPLFFDPQEGRSRLQEVALITEN
eukprot:TRINITY_DN10806_c1_g1_i1.p1 TRINITY_DN10806_c1_g1~~TRINITY_DN10806_c1_g1_i1.p1  ORF type:complete len:170 (+),score=53.32 TRINITY_DN10806_c1_g1_i1:51-560(+)